MTETKGLRLKNPTHPGRFVRDIVIEPLGLSVTEAAKALGITRVALSRFLNQQTSLSPEMAIRLDKAFGADMETLMRMQGSYDIAQAQRHRHDICVSRFQPERLQDTQPSSGEFKVQQSNDDLGHLGNRHPELTVTKTPRTPAMVVATSPFTTIGFDENDKLNTTFDHINRNTYDPIKFCRTTTAIDAEFDEPIPAIVTFASCFLFPRVRGITSKTALDAANRILFRLLFGEIVFNSAKPNDVVPGYLNHTGYFAVMGSGLGDSVTFVHALQNRMTGQDRTPRIFSPRFFTEDEMQTAHRLGKERTSKLVSVNPSLFMNGVTDLHNHDYEASIVFMWTFVEQILSIIWDTKIIADAEPIYKRKNFLESRIWAAAARSELLFQKSIINSEIYEDMNYARDERNNLIHKGNAPTFDACRRALRAAIQLASLLYTDFREPKAFEDIVGRLSHHREIDTPKSRKLEGEPQMWRERQPIPGDDEWGDRPYERHARIELQPMAEVLAKGIGTRPKKG